MSKNAEEILKRLYDNYQNGNEWDKALKDIKLYANTKKKQGYKYLLIDFGIWLDKNDRHLENGNITKAVNDYLDQD